MYYTEDKPFSAKFRVDFKIFALIYICYKYKFPLSFFLTMYEMYDEMSLYVFKAMSAVKTIPLTNNNFTKLVEQSKILYRQLLKGISTKMKIKQLETRVKHGYKIEEEIPEQPKLDLTAFSDDYKEFIENYLSQNIVDLFSDELELVFNTSDLYSELL